MNAPSRIYLDHAATTPIHSSAIAAMLPWLDRDFGNPSSLYQEGRCAKALLDEVRAAVAEAAHAGFGEVVFTSGGTESANLGILGPALHHREGGRKRVLLGAGEHPCVGQTRPMLEALGYRVELVPIDRQGRLVLDALERTIDEDVLLVAAMHANNEIGSISDISSVVELAHRNGSVVFCDAVQSFGTATFSQCRQADLISLSGHKIYGAKGAGALVVRSGVRLKPLIAGGAQEREMRGGTENVAAIAALGAAIALQPADEHLRAVREAFWTALEVPGVVLSCPMDEGCLPGHLHFRIPGIGAEGMLILLDRVGVSASSGAACSSGSIEPSHVLRAAGLSAQEAKEGLRFSFGRGTTLSDAREAATRVSAAARQVRLAR